MKHTIPNLAKMEDRATELLERGRLRQAEGVLMKMLTVDPRSVAAHFNLVRVYWRTRQYNLAVRHAHRTLRLNPRECNVHLNLGLVYDLKGREDLARLHYKKELLRNSTSTETLWNLGLLCFRRHRWREASLYLRKCFDLGYRYRTDETVHRLGNCYSKLGDIDAYVEVYERYVEFEPEASWAFVNLGRALLEAGDPRGATRALARALELGAKADVVDDLARARHLGE